MNTGKAARRVVLLLVAALLGCTCAVAADWPMWRCDAQHSAATSQQLPDQLRLQWTKDLPPLQVAWPDEPRMRFDAGYEPIIVGQAMIIGSGRNDSVCAYDTQTGARLWRFFADGPVRMAPAAWDGKLYAASDDGHLYCLTIADGGLLWKFRGAPAERRVIGNTRLISTWPVRGAPVVADGVVYFAAGIWPFMGVFVYAVDAQTGKAIWVNDGTGAMYINQPHDSPAFAGVAPQGQLAVSGDKLVVAGGRSVPACFDRNTGRFLYFELAPNKQRGDYKVSATSKYFLNSGHLFDLATGAVLGGAAHRTEYSPYARTVGHPELIATYRPDDACSVVTEKALYGVYKGKVYQRDMTRAAMREYEDSKGRTQSTLEIPPVWEIEHPVDRLWLKAGSTLYGTKGSEVFALKPTTDGAKLEMPWRATIEGTPFSMAAADDRLFVSTEQGRIYCFGEAGQAAQDADMPPAPPDLSGAGQWKARADDIIRQTGVTEGYCIVWGVTHGRLAEQLARQSKLHVIAIGPRTKDIAQLRERLDDTGLYGTRVAAHVGAPGSLHMPRYVAGLVAVEDLGAAGYEATGDYARRLFEPLRPYGGVAHLPLSSQGHGALVAACKTAELEGASIERQKDAFVLVREGALPGSDDWTHQYGNAANTVASRDERVKAPLGLLWFGGSTNQTVLPRHGHGPPEQIVGGRLFIEGPDTLRANDVYTGRLLWQVSFPKIGHNYNVTYHQPGANSLGSNFVATRDAIYVVYGNQCHVLDPATSRALKHFSLPPASDSTEAQAWGYLAVWQDVLLAGGSPMSFEGKAKPGNKDNWDETTSKRLIALKRDTGEALWSVESQDGFRHNAIAMGAGKVFCIDRLPDPIVQKMDRRGEDGVNRARLLALDAHSGKVLWSKDSDVFGTWLGYSQERDLLLQAGRPSRDMLSDERGERMIAYRAADGSVLWDVQDKYFGPPILRGDTILTQAISLGALGKSYHLLTGKAITRTNPITGEQIAWQFGRNYGCNTVIASTHLVTFRSAAAGYFDLERDGGTANLGGFKSGCTSNLIVANGVLNAPDYTRTCMCSYQNQTSLALVHDPDVEMWSFNTYEVGDAPVKRLGLNLGAPGDRLADDGTLWLDWPSVGGPSPDVNASAEPEDPDWFVHHISWIEAGQPAWIGASGAKGLTRLSVTLNKAAQQASAYTVRLYFIEPDGLAAGQRMFDVALQGKTALSGFDVSAEAGGPSRVVMRQFEGVSVTDDLTIGLTPSRSSKVGQTVLCGVQILQEGK